MNSEISRLRRRGVPCLLQLLAGWGALFYGFLLLAVFTDDEFSADARAIMLMTGGLIVGWVIIGGNIQRWGRTRFVAWVSRWRWDWRVRFVLLCIVLALIEEAITTGLTNLAPLLGGETDEAAITASKNYLEVVLFHSVIIFVPMFICWAWMLSRWFFRPIEVLLLFGLNGIVAESISFGPQMALLAGMWVFVYGLMIWLPTHTIPTDLPRTSKWWHWPTAIFLPILAAFPFVPVVILMGKLAGVE